MFEFEFSIDLLTENDNIVKLLIENGADVNVKYDDGVTLLHLVGRFGKLRLKIK